MRKLFGTNCPEGKIIEVMTDYVKGRGYVIGAVPVLIRQESGMTIRSYDLMDLGRRKVILEVSRKSKKREAEADAIAENLAEDFAREIANKKGLALEGV